AGSGYASIKSNLRTEPSSGSRSHFTDIPLRRFRIPVEFVSLLGLQLHEHGLFMPCHHSHRRRAPPVVALVSFATQRLKLVLRGLFFATGVTNDRKLHCSVQWIPNKNVVAR